MCGSVGRFRLTTGATSSTKGFGEPWLRTVASRSFGSDGCMLINKTVKGSVVFIQKWVEKLRRVGDAKYYNHVHYKSYVCLSVNDEANKLQMNDAYRRAAELLGTCVSDSDEAVVSCAGSSVNFPQCRPVPTLSASPQNHTKTNH